MNTFPLLLGLVVTAGLFAQTPTPATVNIDSLPPRPLPSAATMERLAKMKPVFDGRTLDGWVQAPVAPFKFANEDLKDFSALAKKLTAKSDAVAVFLFEQLDEAGKASLTPQVAGSPQAKQASGAVLRNLNRVVAAEASI